MPFTILALATLAVPVLSGLDAGRIPEGRSCPGCGAVVGSADRVERRGAVVVLERRVVNGRCPICDQRGRLRPAPVRRRGKGAG